VTDSEINDYLRAHARYELAKMNFEAMSMHEVAIVAVIDERREARAEFRRACEWVVGR
jgi:hypothetical protein